MKQVLIRPSFQDWCENRLFDAGTSYNAVYRDAFSLWKQVAATDGYELATWDRQSLDSADVLWFLDLPATRGEFERIRRQLRPDCRLVLQILETPVLGLHAFHPVNQANFHAVLRYDQPNPFPPGHFHYRLPNTPVQLAADLPFSQRRGLLILNSNRVEGIWAMRQRGLAGLPALGKWLNGWKCWPGLMREYLAQERYSYRRQLARAAEHGFEDFVDVYGRGWNGEQVSWAPFYPNRPYRCWRGVAAQPKLELCAQYRFVAAIENYQGNRGYISEKIFDAMFAGAVPVYLGDDRITDLIPQGAFVDVREFADPAELLRALRSMPEAEWRRKQRIGRDFIESATFHFFGNEQFVDHAMQTLRFIMAMNDEPALTLP